MLNRVSLVGRLTNDPVLRTSKNQKNFCAFTIAVNNTFSPQVSFIPCFAWNKTAENISKYLKKGSLVSVDGRINTRNSDINGQRITIVEVTAENVSFLESKTKNNNYGNSNPNDYFDNKNDIPNPNDLSFNNSNNNDNFNNQSTSEPIPVDTFNNVNNDNNNNNKNNNNEKIEDAILWD